MVRHKANINGSVAEISIHAPCKAILEFASGEDEGRVILWSDRLMVKGRRLQSGEEIGKHLKPGSKVRFNCHIYDNPDIDRCTWFATSCYCLDEVDRQLEDLGIHNINFLTGIVNTTGIICQISKRQAIISFSPDKCNEERVLLLGSKCYIHGKHVSTKTTLSQSMEIKLDDEIKFDAVPFDEEDNDQYSWVATVAWKGAKPLMQYDEIPPFLPATTDVNIYKFALNNPHSSFIRGHGKILALTSEEYGICITPIRENNWQTVLFHRSCAFVFGTNLRLIDLHLVFQPGDRVRFLATPTAPGSPTQWLARQVFIDDRQVT